MLLTLTYAFLTYFLQLREKWRMNRCLRYVMSNIKSSSIIFRSDGVKHPLGLLEGLPDDVQEEQVTRGRNVEMLASKPKLSMHMSDWMCYLESQYHTPHYMTDDDYVCVLLEAKLPNDTNDYLAWSLSLPMEKRIKVSTLASPLAWRSGEPFGILLECTAENYMALGTAFMNGFLVTDEVLEIKQLISVDVIGKPLGILRTDSQSDTVPVFMTPLQSKCSSLENINEVRRQDSQAPRLSIPMEHLEFDIACSNESLASASDVAVLADIKADFENEGQEDLAEWIDTDQSVLNTLDDADDTSNGTAQNVLYNVTPDSQDTGFLSDASGKSPATDGNEISEGLNKPDAISGQQKSSKPPNVLIYCGKKDSARLFEEIRSVIGQCINFDSYTLYHLKHEQVDSTPWSENTSLLIICVENLYDNAENDFLNYFKNGGKILSFCSSIDKRFLQREQLQSQSVGVVSLSYKTWSKVNVISSRYVYSPDSLEGKYVKVAAVDSVTNKPVIVKVLNGSGPGVMILSQVYLEKNPSQMAISTEIFSLLKQSNEDKFDILRDLLNDLGINSEMDELLSVSPIHLHSSNEEMSTLFWSSIEPRLQNNKLTTRSGTFTFMDSSLDLSDSFTSSETPILCNENLDILKFDVRKYEEYLSTSVLGRIVFCADVMKSTQDLLDGFMLNIPKEAGVIAIASQQISGKGRGGNAWLSPEGCALFSLHVQFSLNSLLGHKLPFLQHIASLATVLAVRTIPGYEDINIRLKWPNDIYYGNEVKMGGVLVNSSIMQDQVHAVIGCGFNVCNAKPTVCVNDIIDLYNKDHNTSLEHISLEELIGLTVSQVEHLMNQFQSGGPEEFLSLYYKHWLHGNAKVSLEGENEGSVIQGLDEQGFLQVKTDSGRVLSVQPDGNSFDMMRNLICMKTR